MARERAGAHHVRGGAATLQGRTRPPRRRVSKGPNGPKEPKKTEIQKEDERK
jgi:hypothetical protein